MPYAWRGLADFARSLGFRNKREIVSRVNDPHGEAMHESYATRKVFYR